MAAGGRSISSGVGDVEPVASDTQTMPGRVTRTVNHPRVTPRQPAPAKPVTLSPAKPVLPLLRLGDMGADVEKLQTRLTAHGFSPGAPGHFDAETRAALMQFQRARKLPADGVCRTNSWKALNAAPVVTAPPPNETEFRAKIIELASAEVGTAEGVDATGKPNNTGDILKYGSQFGRTAPQPWCANFASWVMTKAGGTMNNALCSSVMTDLQQHGRWKTSAPKAGDLILFDMVGNGKANHIGIVESVDPDGTINTIEGNNVNSSGAEGVYRSQYLPDTQAILGFGSPY